MTLLAIRWHSPKSTGLKHQVSPDAPNNLQAIRTAQLYVTDIHRTGSA